MVGSLADAGLTAEVADGQPLGQVTFCFPQQLLDLLSRSSLSHWLLLGSCATTTILAGPTFGEQTTLYRHHPLQPRGQQRQEGLPQQFHPRAARRGEHFREA